MKPPFLAQPACLLWVALASAWLGPSAAPADARPGPGEEIFSDAAIRRFSIEIAPAELNRLQRAHGPYVPATLKVGERIFRDVGVRLKGQGSFRPLQDKPSFAVKFDEFVPRQKLAGLSKIMLNNSSQDATFLSEYVATGLFRDAGVPAGRVTHARVELNGRDLGFYVLIEAMNKTFLRQHFKNADGNLYEGYAQDIDRKLEQDGGTLGDQSDVRTLLEATRLPAAERLAGLRQVLEVDRFVSFLAVSMLIAQHDSYPLNRNNYRLYHDPDTGRFVMIAHGIDGTFSRNGMSIWPPTKYILTRALLDAPSARDLYRGRVGSLFTNVFKLEVITNRIQAATARLQDAAPDERERTNLIARTASFLRRVAQRHANVTRQLTGPEPVPLAFGPDHTAHLTGWEPQTDGGTPTLDQGNDAGTGVAALHIKAGPTSTVASWRTYVRLDPGRYRFLARVRVGSLPANLPASAGAAVRLSGSSAARRLTTNDAWTELEHVFTLSTEAEEVQIVCEFRGPAGEAWFDRDSLRLVRD